MTNDPTEPLTHQQFVNTGILCLLVYGTAPPGFTTPKILKDLWIFAGSYDDFSREWQVCALEWGLFRGRGMRGGGGKSRQEGEKGRNKPLTPSLSVCTSSLSRDVRPQRCGSRLVGAGAWVLVGSYGG